ncbi:MAG: amidohydrolase family protein, partial [Pseudomonadota bacterium]
LAHRLYHVDRGAGPSGTALLLEDRKGMLKPGYYADVVVMASDLDALDADAIADAKPAMTVCGGRVTFGGM